MQSFFLENGFFVSLKVDLLPKSQILEILLADTAKTKLRLHVRFRECGLSKTKRFPSYKFEFDKISNSNMKNLEYELL
ncbi:hypothetical protein LEP1GSC060_0985 [Leptospira weilii serovar Ranarum str. ICFT]|uniref:Uncharacterized protein n=1 Tax=Leptospira weilii serovar Ranarum str. ICFT TaxID=1218598 RepID=N1WPP6_9LEPT|nr:hypothetical protein LEP1GSC060_0985 [Leptospira weilii serovar Ranarum str. ICFT]